MASKLGCFGGRLLATSVRAYPLRSPRFITSSAALLNKTPEAKLPATQVSSREGLTGFLEDKTGVTGAWTLGVGVSAYLISKELYVLGSETVIAIVMGGIVYFMMKKIGKPIAEFLDGKSQAILDLLSAEKNVRKQDLEDNITARAKVESELELRHDVFEVMEENNAMRMEEEYRRRMHQVTDTVKRRLDYQVDIAQAQRKFEQQHMVQWLEKAVAELVKGKQDESLAQCMGDLKKMSIA